jgi:hypothetical protein
MAIDAILLQDWDPIGVNQAGARRDEYTAYVGPIYRALASGASEQDIVAVLREIETDSMGISGSGSRRSAAARKLRALDIRLG